MATWKQLHDPLMSDVEPGEIIRGMNARLAATGRAARLETLDSGVVLHVQTADVIARHHLPLFLTRCKTCRTVPNRSESFPTVPNRSQPFPTVPSRSVRFRFVPGGSARRIR